MNIGVFSISDEYEGFHRLPFLTTLAEELKKDDGHLMYFKRPCFFLNYRTKYNKVTKTNNITALPLYTLLPISKVLSKQWLYYLFVYLPIRGQLSLYQKRYSKKLDALWFYKPDQYFLMKHFTGTTCYTHYDNYDDDKSYSFSAHPNYAQTLRSMVNHSDYVFATSHQLVAKLDKIAATEKAIYFPNAVSETWLSVQSTSESKSHKIGFIGSIDDSIDTNIIEALCIDFPNYEVVLIGRVTSREIQALAHKYTNLLLLGSKPYTSLPSIVATFDVGICPYKPSTFNAYRNPLKLYEYSAVGIPSVSTQCDFDQEARALVSIVDNVADFSQAVKDALASDSQADQLKRRSLMKLHTWRVRATQVLNCIKGL